MLQHDYKEMPGRSTAVGNNPHETVMILKCSWCLKTPSKARQDGCPIHELEEKGVIVLSEFNPGGVAYFHGRICLTCNGPIMGHFLRKGSPYYWCDEKSAQFSEGIDNCVYDVEGVTVPQEKECPPQ